MAINFTNAAEEFSHSTIRVGDEVVLTTGHFVDLGEITHLAYAKILITAITITPVEGQLNTESITIQTYDAAGDPVTLAAGNVPAGPYAFDVIHHCNKIEIVDTIMAGVKHLAGTELANTQTDPYNHYIRRALIDTNVSMSLANTLLSTTYTKA